MKTLLDYLRPLSRDARATFCGRCGTTENYVRKAASVGQRLRAETCAAMERESAGLVSRRDLRPEDWWLVWPELVTAEHPIPIANPEQAAA